MAVGDAQKGALDSMLPGILFPEIVVRLENYMEFICSRVKSLIGRNKTDGFHSRRARCVALPILLWITAYYVIFYHVACIDFAHFWPTSLSALGTRKGKEVSWTKVAIW